MIVGWFVDGIGYLGVVSIEETMRMEELK